MNNDFMFTIKGGTKIIYIATKTDGGYEIKWTDPEDRTLRQCTYTKKEVAEFLKEGTWNMVWS